MYKREREIYRERQKKVECLLRYQNYFLGKKYVGIKRSYSSPLLINLHVHRSQDMISKDSRTFSNVEI